MRRAVRLLPVFLLVAAVVLPAPEATADRDVAKLLLKKADKAARGKKHEEAVDLYRRALEECTPFPEAAYGLAVSLEKLDRSEEALAAFVRCRDEIAATEKPSRKVRSLVRKVGAAIKRLGAGYAELEEIDAAFVKRMIAIGKRHLRKDPAWAKRAFESVLMVSPENKTAAHYLDRLGAVAGPAEAERPFTPLFTNDGLPNFKPGNSKSWKCSGGVLTCNATVSSGLTNFIKTHLSGTYSFRATFRVLTTNGLKRAYGLFFGDRPNGDNWSLVINWDNELILRQWENSMGQDVTSKFLTDFDPDLPHRLRVDVTPGSVVGWLDGRKILTHTAVKKDTFDGSAALFVQQARVEILDAGLRR